MAAFATLQDIVLAARERLPPPVWDYVTYGAESETTVRRNRRGLDGLAFVPRIMRDVSAVDPATSLLGIPLQIPVVLAPMGSIGLLDPAAGLAAAEAAGRFGTIQFVSYAADPGFAAIAAASAAPLVYACAPRQCRLFLDELADRVRECGYKAVAYVSEAAYYGRRERDLMSGVRTKVRRERSYASYMAQQRAERAAGGVPSGEGLAGLDFTWEVLARIKERTRLPLILKGVTNAADARLALAHGADVVYVSNHGGRALDHARATIDALPEIVAAVAGRAEVIVDGGFVRGSDVLKAIALGARAVAMGRMQAWALAAGGAAGLGRCLEILEEEIVVAMGLMGATRLDELTPAHLAPAAAPVAPHPLSAFPVVMERLGL